MKGCKILKYADDIRIYRCFKSDLRSQSENTDSFQSDNDNIYSWSKTWDLNFNISKCCVLHFGRSNVRSAYKIKNALLKNKHQEKDLGILFTDKFKFNDHIDMAINKANRQLGIIARVFKYKNPQIIVPLYKSFVRPLLEYNSIIWSPYTNTNIQKLERIQEKMCNLMSGMRSLIYREKLTRLKLKSLQARRIKHQLCFMFKMKRRLIDLCFENFFQENTYNRTRGNLYKLVLPMSKTKYRHNFFVCSIVRHWNKLNSSDINVTSIKLFQNKIDNYLKRANIW